VKGYIKNDKNEKKNSKLIAAAVGNRENRLFPLMLLGNKSDNHDHRLVSKEEAEEFAKKFDVPFYEIS
jgi:hypothetical protein